MRHSENKKQLFSHLFCGSNKLGKVMLALNSSCSFVRGQCVSIVSVSTVSILSVVFIAWCGSVSVTSLYSLRISMFVLSNLSLQVGVVFSFNFFPLHRLCSFLLCFLLLCDRQYLSLSSHSCILCLVGCLF